MDYIAILELTEEMIRGCAQAVATLLKVRAPQHFLMRIAAFVPLSGTSFIPAMLYPMKQAWR